VDTISRPAIPPQVKHALADGTVYGIFIVNVEG
jgi:hypothetical protein